MEALTRLVTDSLARHGFDRPIDPRRLQWSRWFRCDSPHSLLVVPSKPGIFAIAEEIMDLGRGNTHVGTAAPESLRRAESRGPAEQSSAALATSSGADRFSASDETSCPDKISYPDNVSPADKISSTVGLSSAADLSAEKLLDGAALQRCDSPSPKDAALAAEGKRRMLAVLQFSEDDDMAFTLDRMFTRPDPMRTRFSSGRCFLRFVVIEDQAQRASICSALNQWMLSSAEKAAGIPTDFSSSLEFAPLTDRVGRTLPSTSSEPALSLSKGQALSANAITPPGRAVPLAGRTNFACSVPEAAAPLVDCGAQKNLHCPHPLPSGF